jgi:hypothetical protein
VPDHLEDGDAAYSTRIPADIARPDRILGPLTTRQALILAGTAGLLLLGYYATRAFLLPLAYAAMVAPIATVITALALGRRDGISMDRFALAALVFWRSPKRYVNAPENIPNLPDIVPTPLAQQAQPTPAVLALPCDQLLDPGILDLGQDGYAAVAACSTVNFDLRSAAEQQALASGFARWLNSLTGPAQILIRAHRLDIQPLIEQLTQAAPGLPHPALEHSALAHADFLHELATGNDLLTRQALLVVREPAATPTGHRVATGPVRVRHRLTEAARALTTAEITTTALDAEQITGVLTDTSAAESPLGTSPRPAHKKGTVWPSAT